MRSRPGKLPSFIIQQTATERPLCVLRAGHTEVKICGPCPEVKHMTERVNEEALVRINNPIYTIIAVANVWALENWSRSPAFCCLET